MRPDVELKGYIDTISKTVYDNIVSTYKIDTYTKHKILDFGLTYYLYKYKKLTHQEIANLLDLSNHTLSMYRVKEFRNKMYQKGTLECAYMCNLRQVLTDFSLVISVDFDNTLSQKPCQEFIFKLISKGIDVWVVTQRYDELHKHLYPTNPTNSDLYKITDKLSIPRTKIMFTNMVDKHKYLKDSIITCHLDDDKYQVELINELTRAKGVVYTSGKEWQYTILDIIKSTI